MKESENPLSPDVEMSLQDNTSNVTQVKNIEDYQGNDLLVKVDTMVHSHSVVVFTKSWCPFCKDVVEFLSQTMGVTVHEVQVNEIPRGTEILNAVQTESEHSTVPLVYIKGEFRGGCDDIKSLHAQKQLEPMLADLVTANHCTSGTDTLETSKLLPGHRSTARNPLFWFPNVVNNRVVRLTGFQVFVLSVLSAGFHTENWGRYLAVFLVIDFMLRMTVGSFLSPLGMIATVVASPLEPVFRPGPPKQFASFCGVFFSVMATLFYFVEFQYHEIVGAVWIAMLAGASGLEAFFDFCLGCVFFGYGIQFGLLPDDCYRIYTQTRQETVDSYDYKMSKGYKASPPVRIDTDPMSPIALKYKQKTDEWTKDDFNVVRNMQVSYFACPLALAGLAVAFKIGTDWSQQLVGRVNNRDVLISAHYSHVFGALATVVFVAFLVLYVARVVKYPKKCLKEWDSPLLSSSFGAITITVLLLSFLLYDEINYDPNDTNEENPQVVARVFFWIGAVTHVLITVAKLGEFVGRRLELEHVHPHWMILPVGLSVASLVASVVGPFDWFDNSNSEGNFLIARFFNSFAWIMWVTLFVISFFKAVTTHNSDNRQRHGLWIWLASPCMIGLAEYGTCVGPCVNDLAEGCGQLTAQCANSFSDYYFMGLFFFLVLGYATLPHIAFFGREPFTMAYWIECFALDALAACGCLFYALNGYKISEVLQMTALVAAAVCNFCALLHTVVSIVNRRDVFVPEVKWGPLSFMKLTHEAFRGNMDTLKHYIKVVDLDDKSDVALHNLKLFATHFNRFRIMHEEHSKHEDKVIFKTFNDFFPEHSKKYNDDHAEDQVKIDKWCGLANNLLNEQQSVDERKAALEQLRKELGPFFDHFEEHLRGEEDNLNPLGRKYIPLELMKQMSREVWRITDADRWEVIVPFVVNNLPRHMQRVRYLKILTWSMPERAQQIGAMVYRNVDAVMWERLRNEVPEIIPRGVPGWRRYY